MKYFLALLTLLVSSVALAGALGLEKFTCNATATQLPSRSSNSFSVLVPTGGDTVYFYGGSTITTANGISRAAESGFNDIRTGNTNTMWCRTTVAAAGQEIEIEWERQ